MSELQTKCWEAELGRIELGLYWEAAGAWQQWSLELGSALGREHSGLELGISAGHGTGTSARMSETNTGRWNSGWRDGTILGKNMMGSALSKLQVLGMALETKRGAWCRWQTALGRRSGDQKLGPLGELARRTRRKNWAVLGAVTRVGWDCWLDPPRGLLLVVYFSGPLFSVTDPGITGLLIGWLDFWTWFGLLVVLQVGLLLRPPFSGGLEHYPDCLVGESRFFLRAG
jgi:hypothetical protein